MEIYNEPIILSQLITTYIADFHRNHCGFFSNIILISACYKYKIKMNEYYDHANALCDSTYCVKNALY